MSEVTDAVRHALSDKDMTTASSAVKQLLCEELARADPAAQIHKTDYFNHTYVPDVVLGWPDREPREVFLRFVSSSQMLLDDAARIGTSGPVIIDLSPAAPSDRRLSERALASPAAQQASEQAPRLLFTDSEATQHVRPRDAHNLVERLVVSNLMRSARGRLDEPAAEETVTVSRAAYEGAMSASRDDVRSAVAVAQRMLDSDTERRVERTLQMLWWAGGGAPEEFPYSLPDDMELNPTDTRDFLQPVFGDEQDIEDDAVWSRLAHRLSFDMLVDVGEVHRSENLNRLMRHLSGHLELSHTTLDRHERPMPPFDQLAWAIEDKFLCLRGPDWACRFTPHGNRFSQRRSVGKPVRLTEADRRSAAYRVAEADIDEAARQVALSRRAVEPSLQQGRTLRDLAEGFADDASVRTITLLLGRSHIKADYDRMMVSAEPDASVRTMALVAARLLAAVEGTDLSELTEFLDIESFPEPAGNSPSGD